MKVVEFYIKPKTIYLLCKRLEAESFQFQSSISIGTMKCATNRASAAGGSQRFLDMILDWAFNDNLHCRSEWVHNLSPIFSHPVGPGGLIT